MPAVDLACAAWVKLIDMGYIAGLPNARAMWPVRCLCSHLKAAGGGTPFGGDGSPPASVGVPNYDALLKGLIGAGCASRTHGPLPYHLHREGRRQARSWTSPGKLKAAGATNCAAPPASKCLAPASAGAPAAGRCAPCPRSPTSWTCCGEVWWFCISPRARAATPARLGAPRLGRELGILSLLWTPPALVSCLRSDHSCRTSTLVDICHPVSAK